MIWSINRTYLSIEAIWAMCNLFSCSLFLAKWLFSFVELELPLQARLSSDGCIAFFFAFCLSNRIFNSAGLEWLGLEDKNNSAFWSEFFFQRCFLIKGRWFITVLSRGNPVPCCPNMHFQEEIERTLNVAVDTIYCDQSKYSIFGFLCKNLFGFFRFFLLFPLGTTLFVSHYFS